MDALQAHPAQLGDPAPAGVLAAPRIGVPEPARYHVHRGRLVGRLAAGATAPLVLVSGPAGAGKTSLVAEWVGGRSGPAGPLAWLTFEESDTTFWPQVLESLDALGLGTARLSRGLTGEALLGSSRLSSLRRIVCDASERLTVVLDGYELSSLDLAHEVDHLLRHSGDKLCLVFVTRVDPLLPLYRYRLDDDVVEIRGADLSFDDEEASRLLRLSGVPVGEASVQVLNRRVNGWAAGLRFAARALAGRGDPEAAVADVAADATNINEYLVGEVLDTQPPETRTLLLETSVLDQLRPDALEEVVGSGAHAGVERLAKGQLFVEAVPHEAGCYRYFPFFRDLLRARLRQESPERWHELHRATAGWLRRTGNHERALVHLAEVGAWDELAEAVVEDQLGALLMHGPDSVVAAAVGRIPADAGQAPAAVARAALALTRGLRARCSSELHLTRDLSATHVTNRLVPVAAAVVDALRAGLGDPAPTALAVVQEAERALGVTGEEPDDVALSPVTALVRLSKGVALLRLGQLAEARTALTVVAHARVSQDEPALRADSLGYLALVDALEGRTADALRLVADADHGSPGSGTLLGARSSAAQAALARATVDRYDLRGARRALALLHAGSAADRDPIAWATAVVVAATLERADGHRAQALARLAAAVADLDPVDSWLADLLRVEAAQMHVADGDPHLALDALAGTASPAGPERAVAEAAAYVELGDSARAAERLALAATSSSPRTRAAALLVAAGRSALAGSQDRARADLAHSLRLAERQQLRRPVALAGPSIQRLLGADPRLRTQYAWVSRPGAAAAAPSVPGQRSSADGAGAAPGMIEELTAKEREVLRHLAELLSTEEIADQMFVSVNTVRTHVRSILRKLGVNRRNAAVRRARELGILAE